MKIFFATWTEENQGVSLTNVGARNRLMSYYFLRETPSAYLGRYVKNGEAKTIKEGRKSENR